jgi:hypothetical protein
MHRHGVVGCVWIRESPEGSPEVSDWDFLTRSLSKKKGNLQSAGSSAGAEGFLVSGGDSVDAVSPEKDFSKVEESGPDNSSWH